MATEEIEISQLELAEDLAPDMVLPVETSTDTKATTLQKIKEWLSSFFVGKTGKETISGEKTFKDAIIRSQPLSGASQYTIKAVDTNGKGSIAIVPYYTGNNVYHRILTENTTSGKNAFFDVIVRDDGTSTIVFSGSATSKVASFQGVSAFLVPTPAEVDDSQRAVNTQWVNKKVISAPDYANGISTTEATYTCPDKGWLYVVMLGNSEANTEGFAYINGAQVGYVQSKQERSLGDSSIFIPVSKGDILTFSGNIKTGLTKIFYPFK